MHSEKNCTFCKYSKRNPPGKLVDPNVFLSTDLVVGFLDIQPLVTAAAHVLIIPRKHYTQLNDMENDEESSGALGVALSKVSSALLSSVEADCFNVVQNNGIYAGQVIFHVHFHLVIRPRADDPESEKVKELLLNGPSGSKVSYRERGSYSAHVFARGQREDLDVDWNNTLVPKLRLILKSKL